MKITNYTQAINYLETFISPMPFRRIEENPSYDPLGRMRVLLKLLGNPQEKFKSILITGTAGKGSTAYLISHILTKAGFKTGFTLSPHLEKVNERLQVNEKEISDSEFVKLVNSAVGKIERMTKMSVGKPSYFEILVAMAFTHFAQQKIDIAVVEVGIEGKYDATNLLTPLIVVLTNIYLDHTQILGETVEKIAKEAVGAIKDHLSVVTGVAQPSVIKIVEEKCREVGVRLYRLNKDFEQTTLEISLLGEYQKDNASLAIKTIMELRKFGFKTTDEVIKNSLKSAFFPGRFEIIPLARGPVARFLSASAPSAVRAVRHLSSRATPRYNYILHTTYYTLVLDGAHNPAKMKAFLTSLEKLYPEKKKVFLIAFKKDKNIKEMLQEIVKSADKIIVTEFGRKTDTSTSASAQAESIKDELSHLRQGYGGQVRMKYKGKIIVEKDSKKALEEVIKIKPELLVVTGSLYLVGEIRSKIALF